MVSISLRPSRLSYTYIHETGVFGINITTEELAREMDFCGVRSGRDIDKFKALKLKKERAAHIDCPLLAASPVNIECEVTEEKALGSHTMIIARVLAVHIEDRYLDAKGKFDFNAAKPIVYSHGEYRGIGRYLGNFGYSVRKKKGRSAKRGGAVKHSDGRKK
jgi:flavin reductase (DIM6/NTAB) family NADH-FMN oxidoreductase RutF